MVSLASAMVDDSEKGFTLLLADAPLIIFFTVMILYFILLIVL